MTPATLTFDLSARSDRDALRAALAALDAAEDARGGGSSPSPASSRGAALLDPGDIPEPRPPLARVPHGACLDLPAAGPLAGEAPASPAFPDPERGGDSAHVSSQNSRRPWTDVETLEALRLYEVEGVKPAAIADRMGRDRKVTANRIHNIRNGQVKRPAPVAVAAPADIADWPARRDLELVEGLLSAGLAPTAGRMGIDPAEALERWHELLPVKGIDQQNKLLRRLRAEEARAGVSQEAQHYGEYRGPRCIDPATVMRVSPRLADEA